MKVFGAVFASDPRHLARAALAKYEAVPRALGLSCEWQHFELGAMFAAQDSGSHLLGVRDGTSVAVGVVRLANRRDIERRLGFGESVRSDLHLVLLAQRHHGKSCLASLIGDFGFVVWDGDTRTAIAATDAMGIQKVYYTERDGLCCFGSLAEVIADNRGYECQYLAEQAAMCLPTEGLTVYPGVLQLPPGCAAVLEQAKLVITPHWTPAEVQSHESPSRTVRDAVETCRQLIVESVRWNVSDTGDTWSHLSGGLDSSSIVSVAQWLFERGDLTRGLGGTVTFVEGEGTQGDEREYSQPVVARWCLQNQVIVDSPLWLDEAFTMPHLDQPRDSVVWLPRERRVVELVRHAGGQSLLAGFGGDELFTGSMFFFADWIAQGHLQQAVSEMLRWAAVGRVSFWDLSFRNALLPLLPRPLREALMREQGRLLPWIHPAAARRYALRSRAGVASAYAGKLREKYRHSVLTSVRALTRNLDAGVQGEAVEVRYPFLYRPLVEFALTLPPALCARPNQRKWVLREAMRGILPETVRMRVGKGASSSLMAQSLITQRKLLEPLVRDSILADLQVVDGNLLRRAFDEAPSHAHGEDHFHSSIQATMSLEAWLQMRAGRWPPRKSLSMLFAQ